MIRPISLGGEMTEVLYLQTQRTRENLLIGCGSFRDTDWYNIVNKTCDFLYFSYRHKRKSVQIVCQRDSENKQGRLMT